MKAFLFFPLAILLAFPATAGVQSSFIYTKTILKIIPRPGAPTLEPEETSKDTGTDKKKGGDNVAVTADDLLPKLKRVTKEFTVEVRDPAFLQQKDFFSHQPFADKEGMLILVDPPARAQVNATRIIASADVLFVNEDGVIIKIAPSLKLTGLSEPVDSGKPIRAFVYLKAGASAANDIQPGDHIENSYFKTHPVVIQ